MTATFKDIVKSSKNELNRLLLETFLSKFRSGYVLAGKNDVCLPAAFKNIQKSINEMKIRNDDVFVTSFPKAGTTWTQEMVWLLANNLDYEGAKRPLPERFPFVELGMVFEEGMWTKHLPVFRQVEELEKKTSQRFIKTHFTWELLPLEITNGEKSPKIIYIWRNPKDCLVSYYHHGVVFEGYTGTFDEYFELFMAGRVAYTPFWSHILGYWENRHLRNILFLKYEDMKADLTTVVNKVAEFLGKSYTDVQVAHLVEHLSFENMKNNNAVNFEPWREMNVEHGLIEESDGKFMRLGKVGDHKAHMSQKQIEEMDRWTKACLKGTGFEA